MEPPNEPFVWTVTHLFLMEILVSGFNYFVLMKKLYEPRWGELRAHQIGMTTRMIYIFAFAYQLDTQLRLVSLWEFMLLGIAWLVFILVFEWGGSFLIHRPVKEILIGWHIENGYMWPYVLAVYLFAPLIVGMIIRL